MLVCTFMTIESLLSIVWRLPQGPIPHISKICCALLRCKFDAPSACCGGVDFAQWESLAITNTPMFNEEFEGWKYGPVSEKVRRCFTRDGMYVEDVREISWRNSRKGLPEGGEWYNRPLSLEDIRKDAEKVRPYDSVWDMFYDEFDELEVI